MVRFFSSRGVAPAIAVIILIAMTRLLAYDIALWNEACGAQVRTYDLWKELRGFEGFSYLLGAFLALVFPALLARSRLARIATTALLLALLAWVFYHLPEAMRLNYADNCTTGAQENEPGKAVTFLLVYPAAFVVVLNAVILAIDWIVWIVQQAIHRRREVS
jgi:Ca2+/Na+ antiporter